MSSYVSMYANAIKNARRGKKLTRDKLAELSGVPARTILGIENGERRGRQDTIQKLLHALNLKITISEDLPSHAPTGTEE